MPQGRSVGGVIERIDNLHPAVTRGAGVVFHVAAYIKALKVSDAGNPAVKERAAARPTVKQHLAAIRMLRGSDPKGLPR